MAIDRIVGRDRIVTDLTKQYRDNYRIENAREWIEEGFKDNCQQSWESIATRRIEATGYQIRDSLEDAVRAAIVSRLTR